MQRMYAVALLCALGLAAGGILGKSRSASDTRESVSVHIASDNGSGYASTNSKVVDYDDNARIYAVMEMQDAARNIRYFAETESLVINGQTIPAGRIAHFPEGYKTEWFRIESDSKGIWYSNASNGRNWDHWEQLKYCETPYGTGFVRNVDVAPSMLDPVAINGRAVGTMRYKVVITDNAGKPHESPGTESMKKWGISEKVHRISRKGNTGNSIADAAFSMCNSPFIWASEAPSGDSYDNQAERYIGSDCADFCVAATRLARHEKMSYTSSAGLIKQTDVVLVPNGLRGRIYEKNRKPLPAPAVGDFVVWNGHAGIFVKDTEPVGTLNVTDKVLHTLFREPRVDDIGNAYSGDFKILRCR